LSCALSGPKIGRSYDPTVAEPEVARWWGTSGPHSSVDDLFDDKEQAAFAIQADDLVVGSIQYTEENGPDYRHAGIDVFLGTAHQNRGLGSEAVRTLARYLFDQRGHHRITIDPALSNERAIRAYRRIGFRPVGVMRNYERAPDGTWHDGLLMDMLAGELMASEAATDPA
jgi:aminoglycoside 6'-N-acetyltransferase